MPRPEDGAPVAAPQHTPPTFAGGRTYGVRHVAECAYCEVAEVEGLDVEVLFECPAHRKATRRRLRAQGALGRGG